MAQKFIIEGSTLKVGNVKYHRELAHNPENVAGGGYWHIDKDRTTLYLYSSSMDFGKVTIEQLRVVRDIGLNAPSLDNLEWKFSTAESLLAVLTNGETV